MKRKQTSKGRKDWLVPVLVLVFFVYVAYTCITQSITLSSGKAQLSNLNLQIEAAQAKNAELLAEQEIANTPEYREEIARKRDGLVFPNEIIFVDALAN